MKIIIAKDRYIEDIKKEFNNAFPYLKIDFKPKADSLGKTNRLRPAIGNMKLGDLMSSSPEGVITIDEGFSIKQIARNFEEHFGLTTLFYRKSGNLWLEIKMTGDWSIKQQNESGMEVY